MLNVPMLVDQSSANFYMPACRKGLEDTPPTFREGLCYGTIGTILYFDRRLGICSPPDSNIGQFMRVVIRYIDERPERMHENFRLLSLEALRAAWK